MERVELNWQPSRKQVMLVTALIVILVGSVIVGFTMIIQIYQILSGHITLDIITDKPSTGLKGMGYFIQIDPAHFT